MLVTVFVGAWDTSLQASFPVVAASGTLKRASYMVAVEARGFPPDVKTKLTEVEQAAASGLTVESYGKFWEKLQAAKAAAETAQGGAVQYIGVVVDDAEQALERGAVSTFALQMVAEGRGCQDAVQRYRLKTPESPGLIMTAYETLTGGCAGVTEAQKLKARKLLNGLRVEQ